MRFTVERLHLPPLHVEADEHLVEGAHHVFRRDTVVLRRVRSVVALRVPESAVRRVVPHPSGAD
ncbi:MAG TPA: hypothetical protein VM433_10480 [Mycobacteriales bacterium]|nr:hypothetical protein [Mycobacteriales bacterium]